MMKKHEYFHDRIGEFRGIGYGDDDEDEVKPFFAREVGLEMANNYNAAKRGFRIFYSKEEDAFLFYEGESGGGREIGRHKVAYVDTEDGVMALYPIGDGLLTWRSREIKTDDEDEEASDDIFRSFAELPTPADFMDMELEDRAEVGKKLYRSFMRGYEADVKLDKEIEDNLDWAHLAVALDRYGADEDEEYDRDDASLAAVTYVAVLVGQTLRKEEGI